MQGVTLMILSFLALKACVGEGTIKEKSARKIFYALRDVLDFVERYPSQMNIDGVVCISMAQAQLEQIVCNERNELEDEIADLIDQCNRLRQTILPQMVNFFTPDYKLFAKYLTNVSFWHHEVRFEDGLLADLGVYDEPTMREILSHNSVSYNNTSTDVCIGEIMEENEKESIGGKVCRVSPLCETVVLADRNDTSYLLTHRLFYLQIARQSNCIMEKDWMNQYIRNYCSLILKESKTSEILNFPHHDIFIEQVLFCGMEGFEEFLAPKWTDEIISWRIDEGCYRNEVKFFRVKRNANTIIFGCNDHTTGLAAAALALNLRHILNSYDD